MASGETLFTLNPQSWTQPASNAAVPARRNGIPNLEFSQDASDEAIWTLLMPSYYDNVDGITLKLHVTSPATTGNMDWDAQLSLLTGIDIDSHVYDVVTSTDNTNVNGTSGIPTIVEIIIPKADMDAVVKGNWFLLKIIRDGTPDTTADKLELGMVEVLET